MTKEEFKENIIKLVNFYSKRPLGPEQMTIWFQKLERYHSQDLSDAVESITMDERYFPTPAVLIAKIQEAAGRREARAAQQRARNTQSFFSEKYSKSDVGKDSMALIHKYYGKPQGKRKLAEGMLELEKKYPGIGFGKNAMIMLEECGDGEVVNDF